MESRYSNKLLSLLLLFCLISTESLLATTSGETNPITPILTGTVLTHETKIDISKEGTLDWFFCTWSNNGATYHKNAPNLLNDYTLLNADRYDWFLNASTTFTWTNGKEVKSGSKTDGHYISGLVGRGLKFIVPADTIMRVLKIYLGAYEAKGKITAQLEGTALPLYTASVTASQGGVPIEKLCELKFKADSAGRKLIVKYEIENGYYRNNGSTDPNAITGNVSLNAVCLAEDKTATSVNGQSETNSQFDIRVFPNPNSFSASLTLSYSIHETSDISIKIYSITGNLIKCYQFKNQYAGVHQTVLEYSELKLDSGIYFVKLTANDRSKSLKICIVN